MKTQKHIPILFSTPMVQAILDGRKTQTRRTKGLETFNREPNTWRFLNIQTEPLKNLTHAIFKSLEGVYCLASCKCPYGNIGDILWVRETFAKFTIAPNTFTYEYKATSNIPGKLTPSIFLPKQACRIFLEITNIKVERLKDITEEDSIAEGVEYLFTPLFQENRYKCYCNKDFSWRSAISSFKSLWTSINGEDSLELNPFVWVIEFKRVDKPLNF